MSTKYEAAKKAYTAACEAYLRGDIDAEQQCAKALRDLEQARREQAARPRLVAVPRRRRA